MLGATARFVPAISHIAGLWGVANFNGNGSDYHNYSLLLEIHPSSCYSPGKNVEAMHASPLYARYPVTNLRFSPIRMVTWRDFGHNSF